MSLISRSSSSAPFLTDNSESAESYLLLAQGDCAVGLNLYLAKRIKYQIEINKHFTLRHFGDIVHSLTGIISYSSILISEASKHRWYYLIQMPCNLILRKSAQVNMSREANILTEPSAIDAAASPIRPPFRA